MQCHEKGHRAGHCSAPSVFSFQTGMDNKCMPAAGVRS